MMDIDIGGLDLDRARTVACSEGSNKGRRLLPSLEVLRVLTLRILQGRAATSCCCRSESLRSCATTIGEIGRSASGDAVTIVRDDKIGGGGCGLSGRNSG